MTNERAALGGMLEKFVNLGVTAIEMSAAFTLLQNLQFVNVLLKYV